MPLNKQTLYILVCLVQISVLVKFQLQARTVRETCAHLTAQLSFQAAMIMYQLTTVDINVVTLWTGLDVCLSVQFVRKV